MSEADLVIPGYSPNTQNHVVQMGQKVGVRVIGVFTNTIPVGNTVEKSQTIPCGIYVDWGESKGCESIPPPLKQPRASICIKAKTFSFMEVHYISKYRFKIHKYANTNTLHQVQN